jgi:hypothetical protein
MTYGGVGRSSFTSTNTLLALCTTEGLPGAPERFVPREALKVHHIYIAQSMLRAVSHGPRGTADITADVIPGEVIETFIKGKQG